MKDKDMTRIVKKMKNFELNENILSRIEELCQTRYGMSDAKRCENTEDQKNGPRQIEINAITEPAGIESTQQGNQPAGKLV